MLQNEPQTSHTTSADVHLSACTGVGLTRREREVLALVATGHSDKAIAAALTISRRTVSNHVASILRKLGVETRRSAARRAIQESLVSPLTQAPALPASDEKND